MTEPVYTLRVVTPVGIAYEGSAAHTIVPVERGFVGILAHHAPYLTSSAGGKLSVREKNGSLKEFTVEHGFFEFNGNRALFLTHSCSPVK